MANPQLKNGYLKIANEVVDAFAGNRISGEEWQCLWVIIKKTYGFNKKMDSISLSQFAKLTGIQKPHIIRSLNKLLSKKVIFIAKNDNGIAKNGNSNLKTYGFNKNYEQWMPLPKKAIVAKNGNKSLPKMVPTKYNIKDNKYIYVLLAKINQIGKKKGILTRNLTQITQINARLNDGYTEEDILKACENCFDSGWHRSTGKATDLEYILRKTKIDCHINMKSSKAKTRKKINKEKYMFDYAYRLKVDANRDDYE